MFRFIKRLISPEPEQRAQPTRRKPEARRKEAWEQPHMVPAPEVVEGNDETDWDLWQCSVDSQMQSLSPSAKIKVNTTPSQLDELDPFARVSKNSDL
jgi:hypothetical protein